MATLIPSRNLCLPRMTSGERRTALRLEEQLDDDYLAWYDDAQAIYGGAKRKGFSFKSVGIQAQGRTTVLRLNYRNTYKILAMAKAFAGDLLEGSDGDDDIPHVIAPESAGRHGATPQVIDCDSLQHEADVISSKIADLIANGHDPNQIAVIWRDYANATAIERALHRKGVPLRTATSSRDKKALFVGEPSVKLVSMYSSKGLEFETVFVSGLGRPAKADDDAVTEARLLYVAMTRAMTELTVVRLTLNVNEITLWPQFSISGYSEQSHPGGGAQLIRTKTCQSHQ